jgi:threonine dehydrogenase-like Zn-dependent dehydrogenase
MKALIKECGKDLQLKEIPMPVITNDNEVIIKVDMAGICRTDIYVSRGWIKHRDNLVVGHEFSGVVFQSNSTLFQEGDYVACNPIFDDLSMLGVDHDGCFAEYIKIDASKLHHAKNVKPCYAAYVEPIAASLAPLKSKNITKKQKGCFFGNNRISQLTYEIMKDAGYNVSVIDHENTDTIENETYDYVIETFSCTNAFDEITRILKKNGTFILKSRNPEKVPVNFYEIVKKELILEALYYNSFELAVEYAENKTYLFKHLMGKSFPLEKWKEAYEANEVGKHKIFFQL